MATSRTVWPARIVAGLCLAGLLAVWAWVRFGPSVSGEPAWRFEGHTFGTYWAVTVAAPETGDPDACAAAIEDVLARIDARMSTWREDSELSRFNRHESLEPFPMSSETLHVLAAAQRVSEVSGGAFDVTVGPLVNAWGFGPDRRTLSGPDDATLDALRERTGYANLHIDEDAGTARKSVPGLYCDLSAIAKGYAVDAVAEAIESLGHHHYLVDIGGDLRVRGHNPRGEPWQIAIERPDEAGRSIERIVPLTDQALATSGDYRNYYEIDGERISHTINPATGRPITHALASVSVIHEACMMADAYATALMVLGPEEGLRLAESLDLAALFIIRQDDGFTEVMSSALAALLNRG